MAKDAKAPAAAGGDKKDAKAPSAGSKSNETKSEEEKRAEQAAKRKAALEALIVRGPRVWKGKKFHISDVGPLAALRSRFPEPVKPAPKPKPDDLLRWRIAGAAIVERIPLRAKDLTQLDIDYADLLKRNEARHISRYTPPEDKRAAAAAALAAAANPTAAGAGSVAAAAGGAVKSKSVKSIGPALGGGEAEGEGASMGWGDDVEDADEIANRKRAQEEADDRDPKKRAAIDADFHNVRRYAPCIGLGWGLVWFGSVWPLTD